MALPSELVKPRQAGTNLQLRKSWAHETNSEKQSYLDAVLCLATQPSRLQIPTHSNLYNDFSYVHAHLSSPVNLIHFQPPLLPWHHYFLHVYEFALHECGYTGTAVADSSAPSQSAVFDSTLGFGGNGNTDVDETAANDGLPPVQDGPLQLLRQNYWNTYKRPYQLSRDWAPGYPEQGVVEMYGYNYNQEIVDGALAEALFDDFRRMLENGPHTNVHGGVGGFRGDIGLQDASPSDPLFCLHHAQVDRLWWLWQMEGPSNRVTGSNAYNEVKGDDGQGPPVSVTDTLPMLGLAPDAVVGDYLDIQGGVLCYTYSDSLAHSCSW
ncbi:hypothetical protein B0T14DRAFT_417259 [Immersiella caudata]|uniref:Tyrosinase copper-binding domain-containing protein n=1 Tax=Immersiella caudata TaxID=314043 RepID=A0AA39XD07_9PEZI|nr:hypothetical protein B0T14DRAFT_417259 [Immersiella caudata]